MKQTERLYDPQSGMPRFDNIIISPGPGHPEEKHDVGICLDILKQEINTPILGVCLGHQAIAEAFGGNVVQSGFPIHGKVSKIYHSKTYKNK